METITQAIKRAKARLTKKAVKNGLWENFGQDEVHKLKDKYDYNSLQYGTDKERKQANQIKSFDHWCMNFNDKDLKAAAHV